jgi:hypothetical protein
MYEMFRYRNNHTYIFSSLGKKWKSNYNYKAVTG